MKTYNKNTLSNVYVRDAMRRHFTSLPQTTSINFSINILIKYKINGLLTLDDSGQPSGVVSKTDITGAYYAQLPIESPLDYIMASPPLVCLMDDPLEHALEMMKEKSVYRLYVTDKDGVFQGSLAYPDIVGLLYQSCYQCDYSHFRKEPDGYSNTIKRLQVKDVVAGSLQTVTTTDSLFNVMEKISTYRLGAILVVNRDETPAGVISKTDLILAYKHGVDPNISATTIMTTPVQTCSNNDLLETAIKKMIYSDIHRLFVQTDTNGNIDGVFSLADAARCRSGSCHACLSSRITIEN